LGVETIDLYQLHASDMHTPVEETLSFLDEAVKAGKIHYVGLSNFTGWQLQLIVSTAKAMGVQVPVTLQPQYSLLSREIEWEIVPAALHNGIGLLPWSPLAGGFLTGKYQRGVTPPSGTRAASDKPLYQWVSEECQLRSQLGDDRCRCAHRQGDRRDAYPNRVELDRRPPRRHRSDRRCAHGRASSQQPRRSRAEAGQ
jgi:aryl-alcohol dehydrogenase-like predicted oxidoreductase